MSEGGWERERERQGGKKRQILGIIRIYLLFEDISVLHNKITKCLRTISNKESNLVSHYAINKYFRQVDTRHFTIFFFEEIKLNAHLTLFRVALSIFIALLEKPKRKKKVMPPNVLRGQKIQLPNALSFEEFLALRYSICDFLLRTKKQPFKMFKFICRFSFLHSLPMSEVTSHFEIGDVRVETASIKSHSR